MNQNKNEVMSEIEAQVISELKDILNKIAEKSGMTLSKILENTNIPLFSLKKDNCEYLLLIVVNIKNAVKFLTEIRQKYRGKNVRFIYAIIPSQCKELMMRFETSLITREIEKMTSLTQDNITPPIRVYSDLAIVEMLDSGWKEQPDELQNEVTRVKRTLERGLSQLDAWNFSGIMVVVNQYRELGRAIFRLCVKNFLQKYPIAPNSLTLDRKKGVIRMMVKNKEIQVRIDDQVWLSLIISTRLTYTCITIEQTWQPILYGDHQGALRNLRSFYEEVLQIAYRLLHPEKEASNWLKTPISQWQPKGSGKSRIQPWEFRESIFDELLSELPINLKKGTLRNLYRQLCIFTHNDIMSIPMVTDIRKAYRAWNPYFMQAIRIANLTLSSLFLKLKEEYSQTHQKKSDSEDFTLAAITLAASIGTFTSSVQEEMLKISDQLAIKGLTDLVTQVEKPNQN